MGPRALTLRVIETYLRQEQLGDRRGRAHAHILLRLLGHGLEPIRARVQLRGGRRGGMSHNEVESVAGGARHTRDAAYQAREGDESP